MTAPLDLRYTDPLTGSGALAGSGVGVTDKNWSAVTGTGTRGASATSFSGASAGTAFAVADFGMADFDLQVKSYEGLGGGDAIYWRVTDGSNWFRLRQRYQRTTSTSYGPWYGTGWGPEAYSIAYVPGQSGYYSPGTYYTNYQNGIPRQRNRSVAEPVSGSPNRVRVHYSFQDVTRDTYTTTNHYRYLICEKCVAGTVSTLTSWQTSAFGVLRVVGFDDDISLYEPDGQTLHSVVTDSFNNSATEHGIGLGGQDSYSYASNLRSFVLQLPGSLTPPTIESPVDGSDVDITSTVKIKVTSNYGPDNALTNADIRWRESGGSWVTESAVLSAPGEWTFSTSGITAPETIEMQVRGTDSFANTSAWSSSIYFTLRTAPTPPSFVSPSVDDTVVAANIAVVDFGTSTARQARRVADSSGNPDDSQVLQDGLTLTADGANYRVSGDGAIHPVGVEHIQVRRQTADGGSLWSTWESLRVMMQLAHPLKPDVLVTREADSARNVFSVSIKAGTIDDPAAERMDVWRDGIRIASIGVTAPSEVEWIDDKAGPKHDYRIDLVSSNGGVVSVK